MRNILTILILSGLFCPLLMPVKTLAAGWGMERGRADEGDVARLLVDQLTMKRSQTRIAEAIARPLAAERQRQLLGISSGGTLAADLMVQMFDWWVKEVLEPSRAIGENPAASCAEAGVASQTLLGMMQQRALFGILPEDDDKSEAAEEIRKQDNQLNELAADIMSKLAIRCREEALDECVLTGRFEQLIQTDLGLKKQGALMGGAGIDDQWLEGALKECAIYELHFVSNTKVPQIFNLDMVRDTKIKLEVEIGPHGFETGKRLEELLKGETKGAANPFFISVKCSQPPLAVVCMAGETMSPFRARVFEMEMQHREFYVDANGISKERIVGDNKFVFEVADGIYGVEAFIKVPRMPDVQAPMKAVGFAFYTAHKKDAAGEGPGSGVTLKIDRNKRGVYPVIFDFVYADQGSESGYAASDSTQFKLIHKPKPGPLPAKSPGPSRKPLKPSTRIGRS